MTKKLNPKPDEVLRATMDCHAILAKRKLDHVVIGGLAVYLHGDKSNKPRDVDVLVKDEDAGMIVIGTLLTHRSRRVKYGWDDYRIAVLHPNGVRIDVHWAGKCNRQLPYPNPDLITKLQSIPVLGLFALIESKLESLNGGEQKHRQHVVNLIRANELSEADAKRLQSKYQQLFLEILAEAQAKHP